MDNNIGRGQTVLVVPLCLTVYLATTNSMEGYCLHLSRLVHPSSSVEAPSVSVSLPPRHCKQNISTISYTHTF